MTDFDLQNSQEKSVEVMNEDKAESQEESAENQPGFLVTEFKEVETNQRELASGCENKPEILETEFENVLPTEQDEQVVSASDSTPKLLETEFGNVETNPDEQVVSENPELMEIEVENVETNPKEQDEQLVSTSGNKPEMTEVETVETNPKGQDEQVVSDFDNQQGQLYSQGQNYYVGQGPLYTAQDYYAQIIQYYYATQGLQDYYLSQEPLYTAQDVSQGPLYTAQDVSQGPLYTAQDYYAQLLQSYYATQEGPLYTAQDFYEQLMEEQMDPNNAVEEETTNRNNDNMDAGNYPMQVTETLEDPNAAQPIEQVMAAQEQLLTTDDPENTNTAMSSVPAQLYSYLYQQQGNTYNLISTMPPTAPQEYIQATTPQQYIQGDQVMSMQQADYPCNYNSMVYYNQN